MTARRLDPSRMPDWPRCMTRELAAAYVGVSPTLFDAEVAAGKWPAGQLRGARDGLRTWDRVALDAAADRAAGLTPSVPVQNAPESDEDFRSRFRGKAPRGRPETHSQKAA